MNMSSKIKDVILFALVIIAILLFLYAIFTGNK